jgi:hypothetical protein
MKTSRLTAAWQHHSETQNKTHIIPSPMPENFILRHQTVVFQALWNNGEQGHMTGHLLPVGIASRGVFKLK